MSENAATAIPIGPCYAYWGDKKLGFVKTGVTVRYNKETVQGAIEEVGLNVISRVTKQTCELDLVINDLNLSRLRYLYDQAMSLASATTLDTTNYQASTSTVLRRKEDIKLSGTAAATVGKATYVSGTVQVWKNDLTVEYTKGTDWTGTASVGSIKRIGAGAIADGETVIVEYNKTGTVSRVFTGGKLADWEAPLRLVHYLTNGKILQFYAYRAKKIGASEFSINIASEFGGIPMTFHVLGDMTQPAGRQLFYWSKEA
jgi:hypothetical protein